MTSAIETFPQTCAAEAEEDGSVSVTKVSFLLSEVL